MQIQFIPLEVIGIPRFHHYSIQRVVVQHQEEGNACNTRWHWKGSDPTSLSSPLPKKNNMKVDWACKPRQGEHDCLALIQFLQHESIHTILLLFFFSFPSSPRNQREWKCNTCSGFSCILLNRLVINSILELNLVLFWMKEKIVLLLTFLQMKQHSHYTTYIHTKS